MKSTLFTILVAVSLCSGATYAHHSFGAAYLESEVTIKGELVQLLFRSPHSYVHVMAPDEKGEMQRYAVEWVQGQQLQRQGVTRDTLKPGDKVEVTGNPARDSRDHRLLMLQIVRPADGWKWAGRVE